MSKPTVTKLFLGAGLAMIAGAVLFVAAVAIAIAANTFVMNGADIVGLRGSPLAWVSLLIAVVGTVAFVGGVIAGLVSWIGALLDMWQLESKAWFVGLLLLGIFNLGFFAMVAYVFAGPNSASSAKRHGTQAVVAA
jgi:hypothetical protein